jgi:hypothetical protein
MEAHIRTGGELRARHMPSRTGLQCYPLPELTADWSPSRAAIELLEAHVVGG